MICFWLMAQSSAESWQMVGMLLAVGGVLYLIEKYVLKTGDNEGAAQ